MVNKGTYNENDATRITPGARFDDFRNDFQNIFLSRLRSPSVVFGIVKNNLPPFSMVCTLVYHRNGAIKCSKLGSETKKKGGKFVKFNPPPHCLM